MDLSRCADKEKARLSRIYAIGGLACLPFMWLLNVVWFAKHAFKREPFEEQAAIRKHVILSAIGCAFWTIVLVVWQIVFQSHRIEWGATGDYLTLTLPSGRL